MQLINAFLLTLHSMIEPQKLFDQLASYYFKPPKSLGEQSIVENKANLSKAQLRIIVVLNKWLEVHLRDFIKDKVMLDQFVRFYGKIDNAKVSNKLNNTIKKAVALANSSKKPNIPAGAPLSLLPPLFGEADVDFFDFSSTEIARQMCLIEFEVFKNVHPKEFHNQGWNKTSRYTDAPNISKLIDRFNITSRWVISTIVRTKDINCRVAVLAKWIQVAEACRLLNNYNSVIEIVSGLWASPITRLKRTWKLLEESVDQETGNKESVTFQKLSQIVSHERSYSKLREALHSVNPPCLPYIGVYLTDFTFIDVGNKDHLPSSNPKAPPIHNFEKWVLSASVIKEIILYQETSYSFHPIPEIQNVFHFAKGLSEEEAYAMSLIVEPRTENK